MENKKTVTPISKGMETLNHDNEILCSICDAPVSAVRNLIYTPKKIYICEECTEECIKVFIQDRPHKWLETLKKIIDNTEKAKALGLVIKKLTEK